MEDSPCTSDSQAPTESSTEMKFSNALHCQRKLPTPGSPPPLMTAEDYFRSHDFPKVLLSSSDSPGAPSDLMYSVPSAHSGVLLQTALQPPILRMCTAPGSVMTLVPIHGAVNSAAWGAPPWSPHVITAGTFSPPVSAPLPHKATPSVSSTKRERAPYHGRLTKQRTTSESTASSGYQSAFDNESEIDSRVAQHPSTFKAMSGKRRCARACPQAQGKTAAHSSQRIILTEVKDEIIVTEVKSENKCGPATPENRNGNVNDFASAIETDSLPDSAVVSSAISDVDLDCTSDVIVNFPTSNGSPQLCEPDEQTDIDIDVQGDEIKRFICNVCCKAFHTWSELLQHHKRQHLQTRPYRCDRCPRAFQHPYSLRVHRRSQHNDVDACTMFACKHCGKEFASAASLRVHARMHTGERPYACEMCDKTFMRSHQLKMHVRIHTGTKPHRCGVCSKAFTQFKYLKEHCQRHARFLPYKCEICQKAFLRPSHLSKHRRVHSQETTVYPCPECKDTFSHVTALQKHLDKQHRSHR